PNEELRRDRVDSSGQAASDACCVENTKADERTDIGSEDLSRAQPRQEMQVAEGGPCIEKQLRRASQAVVWREWAERLPLCFRIAKRHRAEPSHVDEGAVADGAERLRAVRALLLPR